MTIRPYLPYYTEDAYASGVGKGVNSNRLMAGKGIRIHNNSNGTLIETTNARPEDVLKFQGTYKFESGYYPNDVVFVDPNIPITDQTSTVIPMGLSDTTYSGSNCPMCPGLFVCQKYVPESYMDSTFLSSQVAPYYTSPNAVTDEMSDGYRHYSYNVYYPIYPLIPTNAETRVVESSWKTIANTNFWVPLSVMIKTKYCMDGTSKTMWVSGILSGSVFDNSKLPYHV